MALTYQAGRRIQGTNQDRVGGTLSTIPSGGVGGWKELGRTTLGSEGDDIAVSSLADKRYLMILGNFRDGTGDHGTKIKLNNDTASNYAVRRSVNNGSDSTNTSVSDAYITDVRANLNFNVTYLCNLAGKEKLWINQNMWRSSSGAGIAPGREVGVGKWTNTSDAVSTFTYSNWHTGNYGTSSEAVVLGYDPDDTHTDNFWEELSSVTTTSSGTISSGTITAKKYLMYQIIGKKSSGSGTGSPRFQFNSDTGSNYSQRNGINGTDYAYANQSSMNIGGDGNTAGEMAMFTGFIFNNSSTEKLLIGQAGYGNSAGNNIGNRIEVANKWANTSNSITSILCMNVNFDSGAKMTIWGSD